MTGLPLIFHHAIDAWASGDTEGAQSGPAPAEAGLPLDTIMATAVVGMPGEFPIACLPD